MRKLVLILTVVFLSSTAFAEVPVPESIESSGSNISYVSKGYIDLLNEQTRAARLLFKLLGHRLTPEIGKQIDKIVNQESTALYREHHGSIPKNELHARVDVKIKALANVLQSTNHKRQVNWSGGSEITSQHSAKPATINWE